jgi:hypothetical protein
MRAESALQAFFRWRAQLDAEPGVCWDIETPGLDPGEPTLSVAHDHLGAIRVRSGNILEDDAFLSRLKPGSLLIAHNAKFEAQALIKRGMDARQFVWWDTMLAEWVLLANNHAGLPIGLDETAQRRGASAKDPYVDLMLSCGEAARVPESMLAARNYKDVKDTRLIYEDQRSRMSEAQIRLTIVRSMYAIELAYMELEGKKLDPEAVIRELERCEREIRVEEDALRSITLGANPRAINEMAPVLWGLWPATVKPADREASKLVPLDFPIDKKSWGKATKAWPDGRPSISEEVLLSLVELAETPRQKAWATHHLKLVELISERDKNLRYFRAVCENHKGVVYAEIRQGVAATHRLTCSAKLRVLVVGEDGKEKELGCQLQNVPRHFKGLFVAKRKGYKAANVDQTGAEFYAAAMLSQCPQALADLEDPDFDPHIQTAQVIRDGERNHDAYMEMLRLKRAGDKHTKKLRDDAKPHTFKPLFGGQSGTDAERAYYKFFREHYAGITAAQDRWDKEMQTSGTYTSPTGMVFRWPVIFKEQARPDWAKNKKSWKARIQAVSAVSGRSLYSIIRNLPIQYFATGELAMVSVLCLLYEARATELRYFPIMLVHDAAEGEVHEDDAAKFHDVCGRAYGALTSEFLWSVYGIDYTVKLAAESQVGDRFGDGEAVMHAYKYPQRRAA